MTEDEIAKHVGKYVAARHESGAVWIGWLRRMKIPGVAKFEIVTAATEPEPENVALSDTVAARD
ncbi:MAG TPA: hypothetical protein VKT72_13925 [Candidatus Baltobacteraceae bacterium]|nr:hypothetical protein [Candidatus Baltobacteraceae bacterium]